MSKTAMQAVEERLERNPLLPKWDILIHPESNLKRDIHFRKSPKTRLSIVEQTPTGFRKVTLIKRYELLPSFFGFLAGWGIAHVL